jgi:hypothetical protein
MAAVSATSRPVWVFVAIETGVAGFAMVVGGLMVRKLALAVVLDDLPPWRAMPWFPLAGVAGYVVRALGPIEAVRRWHGIAVRRIDERWAAER